MRISQSELNYKIIAYMNDNQTFEDYVDLVKRSNTVKAFKVDWDKIQETYLAETEKWQRMLDELGGIYEEDE